MGGASGVEIAVGVALAVDEALSLVLVDDMWEVCVVMGSELAEEVMVVMLVSVKVASEAVLVMTMVEEVTS